jgi:hypothetical protein
MFEEISRHLMSVFTIKYNIILDVLNFYFVCFLPKMFNMLYRHLQSVHIM